VNCEASCFPHVTNIATKTGLKYLTQVPADDTEVDAVLIEEEFPLLPPSSMDAAYRDALEGDVVAAARKLVNVCRASGQRREALREIIKEGNAQNLFTLDELELLRDVDTRWSSTFYMIDRLILMYLV
jgi:hypothetical protein